MKKLLLLITLLCMVVFASCSNSNDDAVSQNRTLKDDESMQSGIFSEKYDSRSAITPTDLIGHPNRIYIIKDSKEIQFEPDSDGYEKILKLMNGRFPEAMKEAAMAILWLDDKGNFDWNLMSDEFNYLRLTYNNTQTVKMNCMHENYKGLPVKELTFNDIIFPLSEGYNEICIVGTQNTYGVLVNSSAIMSEILAHGS